MTQKSFEQLLVFIGSLRIVTLTFFIIATFFAFRTTFRAVRLLPDRITIGLPDTIFIFCFTIVFFVVVLEVDAPWMNKPPSPILRVFIFKLPSDKRVWVRVFLCHRPPKNKELAAIVTTVITPFEPFDKDYSSCLKIYQQLGRKCETEGIFTGSDANICVLV